MANKGTLVMAEKSAASGGTPVGSSQAAIGDLKGGGLAGSGADGVAVAPSDGDAAQSEPDTTRSDPFCSGG